MIHTAIGNRTAIPLRALPFVTAGAIDGLTLATFVLADDDPWNYPTLELFRLDHDGGTRPLSPASFVRMRSEMQASRSGSLETLRQQIPAGVWIWADEAKSLFSAMAFDYVDCLTCKPDYVFGEWSLDPVLSPEELAFICKDPAASKLGVPVTSAAIAKGKLQANGEDPTLKSLAQQIAAILAKTLRRQPTRNRVAAEVAKQLQMKVSTVERRIRRPWWPQSI